MPRQIVVSSELAVHAPVLWRHAVSPLDINAELRPWLSMSFPDSIDDITAGWEPGRFRFRSWIRLGGLIPVEYDDLALAEVEPGHYFYEVSSLATQSVWKHRREITSLPGGARITDTVSFTSRLPLLEPLFEVVFRWVFRWRHHNLRRMYGNRVALAATGKSA
jgi:hypothetical protein